MTFNIFAELSAVIIPVFLMAGVGFYLFKSGQAFEIKMLSPMIVNFGTPSLVVYSLINSNIRIGELGEMALISFATQLLFGLLGFILFKSLGWKIRTYLPPLMFPNNGNLGLPLCLFAFGEQGMALGIAYFSVLPLTQFTIGQAIAVGHMDLKKILKTPLIWAVLLALVILETDFQTPLWAMNFLELCGAFTIPLLLITLGISLAKLKISSFPRATLIGAMRVFGGVVVGFFFVWLFDLEGVARGVVLIQAAMPAAVYNYLFASLHDAEPEEVAGIIIASSLLCFITLPLLLPWVL